jgi:hypothetical protein
VLLILFLKYNEHYDTVVTCDVNGMIEYWNASDFKFPSNVDFKYKTETDLYEFVKVKAPPHSEYINIVFIRTKPYQHPLISLKMVNSLQLWEGIDKLEFSIL